MYIEVITLGSVQQNFWKAGCYQECKKEAKEKFQNATKAAKTNWLDTLSF